MEKAGPRGLGEFELVVLLAVVRVQEDAYGPRILEEIETRTQRSVSRGSVYITLDRLESKGLVRSRKGEATPMRGGRKKRLFKATAAGLKSVRRALNELENLSEGLEPLLERS